MKKTEKNFEFTLTAKYKKTINIVAENEKMAEKKFENLVKEEEVFSFSDEDFVIGEAVMTEVFDDDFFCIGRTCDECEFLCKVCGECTFGE